MPARSFAVVLVLALAGAPPVAAGVIAAIPGSGFKADGVVTVGDRTDPFAYSFKEVEGLFGEKGLNVSLVEADPSSTGIKKAIEQQVKRKKTDILLFIAGHGPAEESHLTTVDLGAPKHEMLTGVGLGGVLGGFPSTTFKVVIESCSSGRFIPALATRKNVAITITSSGEEGCPSGLGAELAYALRQWAFPPSGQPNPPDLVGGLRVAFDSAYVRDYAVAPNGPKPPPRPQISPAGTSNGIDLCLIGAWRSNGIVKTVLPGVALGGLSGVRETFERDGRVTLNYEGSTPEVTSVPTAAGELRITHTWTGKAVGQIATEQGKARIVKVQTSQVTFDIDSPGNAINHPSHHHIDPGPGGGFAAGLASAYQCTRTTLTYANLAWTLEFERAAVTVTK